MLHYDYDEVGQAAGGDGASVMSGPIRAQEHPADDYEDLMGAWLVERSRAVEAELLLTRTRDLLELLASPDRGSLPISRREIRRLIAEINEQIR